METGTSSQNDVDMSWIPQETLNQISKSDKLGQKCFSLMEIKYLRFSKQCLVDAM